VDAPTFLQHLRRSRLLTKEQVHEVAARLDQEELRTVAVDLVAQGLLTRFQTKQLLGGHHRGFYVGQYLILDQIGMGAMGIVYKALHTAMDRLVALKVFKPVVSTDDQWRESMFQREASAAGELNHPNIVAVYDAAKSGDLRFIAMEYVKGRTLKRLVRKKGPLPVPLACELMRQACRGLQYAHERGVVHRDIKPSNMLVLNDPKEQHVRSHQRAAASAKAREYCLLKISDFGLARLQKMNALQSYEDATLRALPGVVWGTLDYISPEQLRDVHAADIRSDLYSLGCTFYYALTGQPPLSGDTPIQKLINRATRQAEPLSSMRPDVPPAISEIVQRLMDIDPSQRFQTPRELAHELEGWCDSDCQFSDEAGGAPENDVEPASVSTFEIGSHATKVTQEDIDIADAEEEESSTPFTPTISDTPIVTLKTRPGRHTSWSKKHLLGLGISIGIAVLLLVLALILLRF
jgi:serine/threonine protein kinase